MDITSSSVLSRAISDLTDDELVNEKHLRGMVVVILCISKICQNMNKTSHLIRVNKSKTLTEI